MKKLIPNDAILVPDEAELKFEGEIFEVYQWPQKLFDGTEGTFEMLKRTDTINVISVVDGKVVVLNEQQPHFGNRQNFPGGRVDDTDADILEAAQREMAEETGYHFTNWRLVHVAQPYRKIEWFVHTWLAWDSIMQNDQDLDAGEKINISTVDFQTLKQMVMGDDDYLGKSRILLKGIDSIEQLLNIPEFSGQEVDR